MGDGARSLFCPKCSAPVSQQDNVCPGCGASLEDVSRTLTSGFTALLADDDWERFAPGNFFANRYTIIEEVGHGGMGRVFKALDRSLGITVAIKVIRPEYASNPRVVELFKQETVLARSISSENVVRVHDLGEAEKTKYISMDFVEGQNLRDLIHASGSLTISTAVKFGQQVCSALSAAHKEGIVHRDLKPSNIMIDKTGRVRVMDFGLAKTIDREDAGAARAIVGTPEYLSPEQARGENLDQRTDIYALGLILYEMVTGRPVFEAESLSGYIQKHCEAIPEPPSRLNRLVPAGLEALILKCLRKDRNERFQAADEVCQSLDRVIASGERPRKVVESWWFRFSVVTAACSLVGFIVYWLFVSHPGPPIPSVRKSVAVMNFENITRDPSQERWRDVRNALMIDLEQSRLLRVVTRERLLQCLNDLRVNDAGVYAQADLDKIASREKVDFFLLGEYAGGGAGCRIDIRIIDARLREPIVSQSFYLAVFDEIQSRSAEISLWIKEEIGFTKSELARDFDREFKKYPTRSTDALVHFFRGLEFYGKRDLEQSSDSYLKAVALDKDFALAYARLAINLIYQGRLEEAKKNIRRARALQNNLSRREKLMIEGYYYALYESDYANAARSFEALLRDYPDDEIALEEVGAVYRNTEEWDKAMGCFERLKAINPHSRIAVRNLIFIAAALGQHERAEGILQENRQVFSASEEFQKDLLRCLLCRGRADQALSMLEHGLSPTFARADYHLIRGHIQTVLGNYGEAEEDYRRLKEEGRTDQETLEGAFWLAQLYLLRGQSDNCFKEIEEALIVAGRAHLPDEEFSFLLLESGLFRRQKSFVRASEAALKAKQTAVESLYREDQIKALHQIGLCQADLGQVSEARRTSLLMKQIINKIGYPKLLRNCYHLEGIIAAAGKSWDEAAGAFQKAVATLPGQRSEYLDQQAVYVEALASALLQQGDLEGARDQYEKVILLTTGRLTSGDAYARSLFQLGTIYQETGTPAAAKECFQRYLAVRGEADPALTEVQEARRRLELLT